MYSDAQIKTRVEAFMETLENRKKVSKMPKVS
jgi:hypothetical protein